MTINTESYLTKKLVYFLVGVFPLFFLIGPFFLELFAILISIYFLKEFIKNKSRFIKNYKNNYVIVIISLFCLYLIASSFFSEYWSYTIPKSFFYVRYIIFSLALAYVFEENNKLIIYFFYSLLLTFFLLFVGSFYEIYYKSFCGYFNNSGSYIYTNDSILCTKFSLIGSLQREDRLSSFFGNELILGSFLSRLLPLLSFLFFFIFKDKKNYYPYFFIFIFVTSIIIFLSGERLSFFFNLIFLFMILIFYKDIFLLKLFFFISIIFFIFFISSISNTSEKRMFNQTFSQILDGNSNKNEIFFFASVEHRLHGIAAYNIFLDNKIIGSGINTFRKICPKKYNIQIQKFNSCTTHPHNTFLQLLSEVGILGFLFPFFLLLSVIYFFCKSLINLFLKKNTSNLFFAECCIMTCFLITLFPIIPSGNFFTNFLNYIYYLPLGFYIYFKKNI